MNSTAYINFRVYIDKLRSKLPIYEYDDKLPIMEFNEPDKDIFTLIVILAHAELENYFEDIAYEIVHKSTAKFFKTGEIDNPLANLMFRMNGNEHFRKHIKLHESKNVNNYIDKITDIYSTYVLKANHGITFEKVYWIFQSIGKDKLYKDFNDDMYLVIDDLKAIRGKYVHTSIRYRIQEEINPKSFDKNLNEIVQKIQLFDESLIT